jgi:hypothetical protein
MTRIPFSPGRFIFILLLCFISNTITGQKVKPDTLTLEQLNLYRHNAIKLRNTGRTLTLSGTGILLTGIIAGSIIANNSNNGINEELEGGMIAAYTGIIGIPLTLVGIPLWAVGNSRKLKAEFALKKFNSTSENPMAVGAGITIRF